MRRRSTFAIAILIGVLILAAAVPAHAALRLRVYRGATSEGQRVVFRVERTDAGRFIREMTMGVTFTCEDATTQEWWLGFGFARNQVPIVDGVFSYDSVDPYLAVHIAGRLGWLRGEGTLSLATTALTEDEQAVLCHTGDLTWQAEYVRTITRPRFDPKGRSKIAKGVTVHIAPNEGATVRTSPAF